VCLLTMCEILYVYSHCLRFIFSFNSIVRAMRSAVPFSKGHFVNLLKPNDIYICRTAALNSISYILNIYSTNIHTEYFKHAA